MADVKRVERPLSPHLSVYRPQITSVSSIFTRITGNGQVVGFVLGVWWLLAASVSDDAFATASAVLTSWFGDLVFTGLAWAVWYHFFAGLRHVYYDSGRGLDVPTAQKLGWACFIGATVMTVLTVLVV